MPAFGRGEPVDDKERERERVPCCSARRTGHVEDRALLPTHVTSDEVSATLSEGVLTVTAPRAHATKPRHIDITGT
ncbi:Hsp20/alpha crystallin family protein [Streptomyces sp. NPDC050564]|uniref:Hsp20/alpha crystallin family protein n=1 Tax=Streptomyces sp. NPDC050564 TaxID=3365631 RepID=UPI0037A99AE4